MAHDALKPSMALLCKLGSIVIHAEEGLSSKGHHFDITELKTRVGDPEVRDWLRAMDDLALIPKRRSNET